MRPYFFVRRRTIRGRTRGFDITITDLDAHLTFSCKIGSAHGTFRARIQNALSDWGQFCHS